jgi:hypothetical protein
MPAEIYFKHWGLPPEKARGKSFVHIQDVARIEDSPSRLPPDIADKIYQAGESGMGYYRFTLIFSDGAKQEYGTGDLVDFVPFPADKSRSDIIDVVPGYGPSKDVWQGLKSYSCLYS